MDHSNGRILILLIFVLNLTLETQATSCQIPITPGTIADSWQSSSYFQSLDKKKFCFKGGSGFNNPESNTYNYFHTTESVSDADKGFHWFVVKLKETTVISSMSLKNRETNNAESAIETLLNSRSADIEIWVSQTDHINFGTDHCTARSISSQFSPHADWKQCGSTPSVSGIVSGQVLTVTCWPPIQVRYLLLRKKFNKDNVCMSFVNMWINKAEVKAELFTASGKSDNHTVLQGSRVTVRCTPVCTNADVKICPPKDSCQMRFDLVIDQAKQSNSGNYTCDIGPRSVSSVSLIVQHPPSQLSITPTGPVSCGQLSTSHSQPAAFQVESSAAEPPPVHECTARDITSGESLVMGMMSSENKAGSLRSNWQCANCSNAAKLNVTCTAKQSNGVEKSESWTCEPASSVNIIFDKTYEKISQKMEVNFELVSYAASPEPVHKCHAAASEGHRVEEPTHWPEKLTKGEKGVVRSHWTATVSTGSSWRQNDQLRITCSVSSPNAWFREATDVWSKSNHNEESAMSAWTIIMLIAGVLFLILVVAISSCACVKLKQLSMKPGDLVRASAVGTRQAIQYLAAVNQQQGHAMYDNAETYNHQDDVYDVVHKIEELKVDNAEIYID